MILPTELQDGLVTRLKKLFTDYYQKVNIFRQHLPIKRVRADEDDEDEDSKIPYVIVKLEDGGGSGDRGQCKVYFIICTKEKPADADDSEVYLNGYEDCVNICNIIMHSLETQPVIDKLYECQRDINWYLTDFEDSPERYPYFFAGIETRWEHTRIFVREDIQHLI